MSEELYTSYATGKKPDLSGLSQGLSSDIAIQRTAASDVFRNISPNISVRDSFTKESYDYFRPDEKLPKGAIEEMSFANIAYKKVGLIRNVVDLMSDFTCQGIQLVHKNKKWQKFYREWAKKIDFVERSERFANLLYRIGNVVVKRSTAKLKESEVRTLIKGFAAKRKSEPDLDVDKPVNVSRREIPWDYEFINPCAVTILGGELGSFVGKPVYTIKINENIISQIKNAKTKAEKDLISQIPDYVLSAIRKGQKDIVLDPAKVNTFYYKKDDWEPWASPMLTSIMDDIIHFNKLRLADNAALDGIINAIRVWKLGSLEHKIMPNSGAFSRLSEVLMNNVGGGSMDLIWGPDIELEETSTESHKFLGPEKYSQVLNNMFSGLGIPPTLTGTGGTGFTNNMVSLKTLIERLEYGRTILKEFWEREIKLVQKAMGIDEPAYIVFERATLTDEIAEKALWIQLCDRDIISTQAVQQRFGLIPEVQDIIRTREEKMREKGKMPPKAGPYHNASFNEELIKIALQQGTISPVEAGIENVEDKSLLDYQGEQAKEAAKVKLNSQPKGVSGQGRPKTSKDKNGRKTRTAKPIGSNAFLLNLAWANDSQRKILSIINPLYFEMVSKKDLRELTEEEFNNLEYIKNSVLFQFEPLEDITEQKIVEKIQAKPTIPEEATAAYKQTVSSYVDRFGKQPSLDEQRRLFASIYAYYKTEEENDI